MTKQHISLSKPLFRDPKHDGAADPMLVIAENGDIWMFYTSRRAKLEAEGNQWFFGTQIGVAILKKGSSDFEYKGEIDLNFEDGVNTFWAPDIKNVDGVYHMFVTYSSGISDRWRTDYRMAHYTSSNLWDWKFEQLLDMVPGTIDASVTEISTGHFRMWYKRCNEGVCGLYYADSNNLVDWEEKGLAIEDRMIEGPNVFIWKGSYWMIVDTWTGQDVYHSSDAVDWEYQTRILDNPGNYEGDYNFGHHASVLIKDNRAFITYFTHNIDIRSKEAKNLNYSYDVRRSYVQIAEIRLVDGNIVCDRNAKVCLLN